MSAEDRYRWDKRYRERGPATREPSSFLVSLAEALPHPLGWGDALRRGRALDVAGGAGRNAIWMAHRGLDVLLADVSEVALSIARTEAAAANVSIATVCVDLEEEPLPAGPWDVILCFHFLRRELFAAWPAALAPGGLFIFCQATRKNLERHDRPPGRFLLDDGELPRLARGLETVSYEEGWQGEGRHEARLVARRVG